MKNCENCSAPLKTSDRFCSNCGMENKSSGEQKRNNIQAKQKKTIPVMIIAGTMILLVTLSFMSDEKDNGNPLIPDLPKIQSNIAYPNYPTGMKPVNMEISGNQIEVSLDDLKQHKMISFNYIKNGMNIPLLAYLSEDGTVITAVRVCEPCKSITFHITGDELICNSCGSTWDINTLSPIEGACGPYPPDVVPNKIINNKIVIEEATIKNWKPRI
ncbi:MAG: DUF2318 domain-containing protein [Calditrichia bacterium]